MIRIVQCLCPARHCIVAIAYDEEGQADEAQATAGLRATVGLALMEKIIDPWCAICHSHKWTYENSRTRFATMAEALPELQRLHAEQMAARAILGKAGQN